MNFVQEIVARAKANKQRIVLPEGTEIRTLTAANQLIEEGVVDVILIGNPKEIKDLAEKNSLKNIKDTNLIDPLNHSKKEEYTQLLLDLRKSKGVSLEEAQQLVQNPLYLACLMIKNGDADGEVAGAENTTGDVLRPAFQIVKTQPGISVVSGAFLMFMPEQKWGHNGLMVFADCAVHPNPNAAELAQIAVATAQTTRSIAGFEPKVAMLSFSTKGSAKHEMVDKVVEATRLAKELDPSLQIDGELQVDAAIVAAVANSKAPGSKIAGHANVLVFPTLEAGNIGYKLVQRLANAVAIGPILQGMAAPINDLSRGCSADEIFALVAITANQAIGLKNQK
ncbi:MAG: phosphate acetyltransferase [Bacteroidales bacterium]